MLLLLNVSSSAEGVGSCHAAALECQRFRWRCGDFSCCSWAFMVPVKIGGWCGWKLSTYKHIVRFQHTNVL